MAVKPSRARLSGSLETSSALLSDAVLGKSCLSSADKFFSALWVIYVLVGAGAVSAGEFFAGTYEFMCVCAI